jgi:hypothetical protein
MEGIRKRPYRATILAGIFFGAAFLVVCLLLFPTYPVYSWQYYFMGALPSFLIYLICGFIVLSKWVHLSFSQRTVLVAIGVHYVLYFFYNMMNLLFTREGSLSTIEFWLSYYPRFILTPLNHMYDRFIIMPRTVYDNTGAALIKWYYWETGVLFPILRIVYAGFIGFCFGKCIHLYRTGYLSRCVEKLSRYSYLSFMSILLGVSGYALAFSSEGYFVIFFLFSILSIVFGHISRKRIIRSKFHIRGKWLSITGLSLGYTLLALSILILLRCNDYI